MFSQDKLMRAATDLQRQMDAATREGFQIDVRMTWRPGLSFMLQSTRCHYAEITLNGVLLETETTA